MCILLATTKHPDYPIIILSNRDEYFKRATKQAHWRDSESSTILAPEDCAKPTRGTWIGVNAKLCKFAVVLNYYEYKQKPASNDFQHSRGKLVMDYLDERPGENVTVDHIINDENLQGFNFLYGDLLGKDLRVVSNRDIIKQCRLLNNNVDEGSGITFGISNSSFLGSSPWEKVEIGQSKLNDLIEKRTPSDEQELIEALFEILNFNNGLPKDGLMVQQELQKSIFIPRLKTKYFHDSRFEKNAFVGDYYGTRTQTVILVKRVAENGNVRVHCRYIEKTLHDHNCEDSCRGELNEIEKGYKNKQKLDLVDESFDLPNVMVADAE